MVRTEEANLVKLESQKDAVQTDISQAERAILKLREELTSLQITLDERSKVVDQVKKTTSKASKVLDLALKEITTKVWTIY